MFPPRRASVASVAVEPLRGQLDHLARGICGRRADGRAHRRQRRRAARDRRERAAGRVADLHLDAVEREPQLLRRDHPYRRARAGADVLHRRDDVGAAVGAEPNPRVAGRTAAAVPDLARHPHPALPDLVRAGADLGPAGPVRFRAPVALHQALRGERAAVHGVRVRVVELAQLERVDAELRRQLVEDALERPRPLDETGRAERGHRRDVQLRAVLDRAHVLAGIEQLRRPGGRRQPARPAERAGVLAAERGQRPVGPPRRGDALAGGVAVAADDVLLAARERAAHRPARPLRQLGCEEDVVADAGLGPEAAAHELADHPHFVLRQAEAFGQVAANPPDVLGRDVDVDAVAAPLAHALVRLERVVVERLRRVLGLDDDVGLSDALLVVAALVAARFLDHGAARDRLVGVEQRLELVPHDLDQFERRLCLLQRLGCDARHRGAFEMRFLLDPGHLSRPDDAEHAGRGRRRGEIDATYLRARVRAAQERALEHSGELDVAGVAGLPARLLVAVEARGVPAHDRTRPGGPLDECILLDERPDLLVAALDLLLGLDQPCHVLIASSMRG